MGSRRKELGRIADREERLATEAQVAQRAMGTQRRADRNEDDGRAAMTPPRDAGGHTDDRAQPAAPPEETWELGST